MQNHEMALMCKSRSRDLGFEYTEALCRAIEAYTFNAEAKNPSAFEYRGANLKYAVERHLYFAFVNNESLYVCFQKWAKNELHTISELQGELEQTMAWYLCGATLGRDRIRVRSRAKRLPSAIPSLQDRAVAFLKRMLHWTQETNPSQALDPPSSPILREGQATVLIHVSQRRFVRYLKPITDRLQESFAYLLVSDQDLKLFLIEQGLPFIDVTGMSVLGEQPCKKTLGEFQHLTILYDRLLESLTHLKPRCVVMVEGNSPQDEVLNQVCQQLSVPIICIQQGWSPIIHNGFRNMTYTKMLVWGEAFKELLQPYNPHQQFVVTGSHIIDCIALPSHRAQLSHKGICFFLQGITRLINKNQWAEFLELVKWVATKFTHTRILVREHPSCPLSNEERAEFEQFPNIFLVPTTKYSIGEVLQASRLSVSIYSSTILESIAAGVPPLIFNATSLPRYLPDVQAAGSGIEVKDSESARNEIVRIMTDEGYAAKFEPGLQRFRRQYFCQDDGKPVERIVEEIASFCRTLPSVTP